jgi:dissimilatory sulfite reductase (desulfoviridin) alpha/beta subunit
VFVCLLLCVVCVDVVAECNEKTVSINEVNYKFDGTKCMYCDVDMFDDWCMYLRI